jgi:hypothetical protein
MRKLLLLIFIFSAFSSYSQRTLNVSNGFAIMSIAGDTVYKQSVGNIKKAGTLANPQYTITGNGQTVSFYFAEINTFQVDGVVVPLTPTMIYNTLLQAVQLTGTVGAAAAPVNNAIMSTAANQIIENVLTQMLIDSVHVADSLLRRSNIIARDSMAAINKTLKDSLSKMIQKAGGVSDSNFIKRNIDSIGAVNKTLKDSLSKLINKLDLSDSIFIKRNTDSIAAINRVLKDSLYKLITKPYSDSIFIKKGTDSLAAINKTLKDSLSLIISKTTSDSVFIKRSLDSLSLIKTIIRDSLYKLIIKPWTDSIFIKLTTDSIAAVNKTLKDSLSLLIKNIGAQVSMGTNAPILLDFNSNSNVVDSVNVMKFIIENMSITTNATFIYGGLTYTLGAKGNSDGYPSFYTMDAIYDEKNRRYSLINTLTVNAAGSQVRVTKVQLQN